MAKSLGLAAKAADTKTFGPMVKLFAELGKDAETMPAKLKAMGAAFGTMFGPLNIIINLMQILFDQVMALDKAQADLSKTTGFAREQFDGFIEESKAMGVRELGITMDDLNKSMQGLVETQGTLLATQPELAKELARTSALFGKLGIDGKTSQDNFRSLSIIMTGSVTKGLKQAQVEMTKTLAKGKQMGIMPKTLSANFKQFAGAVAAHGGEVQEEMLKMSAMADKTGVSIDKMLSIAKKFQTFKDGADTAAQLNSLEEQLLFPVSLPSLEKALSPILLP